MKAIHPKNEKLVQFSAVFFALIGAIGAFWIVFMGNELQIPALITVFALFLAVLSASLWSRSYRVSRFPVRILKDWTSLTIEAQGAEGAAGPHMADVLVETQTTYQSQREGLETLRLQKFVAESSRLHPPGLLRDWQYVARISPPGLSGPTPSGEGMEETVPEASLSQSRSLFLEYTFPRPLMNGESVTLSEDMRFPLNLCEEESSYLFQIAEPTAQKDIHIRFLGISPQQALFRLDNGHREYKTGNLEVSEQAAGESLIHYRWNSPQPGEELRISWIWSPQSVKAAQDAALAGKNTMPESFLNIQETNANAPPGPISGPISGPTSGSGKGAADGESGDGASANDHPIIRQARARLGMPAPESSSEPGENDDALVAQALAAFPVASQDKAGTEDEQASGQSAEEHPLIKAARIKLGKPVDRDPKT